MAIKNKADLGTENSTDLASNTLKLITATLVRTMIQNIIDSAINRIDDVLLLNLQIFTTARTYVIGECCIYDNGGGYSLYRCTVQHLGAWNAAHFTVVGVTSGNTSYTSGITAHAGGGQGAAVALASSKNRVDTVATDGDSVKFPAALPGNEMQVYNNAANSMDVFPAGGENFLGMGANIQIPVAGGQVLKVFCYTNGVWTLEN